VRTFLHPLTGRGPRGGWVLQNASSGRPLAVHVQAAFDSATRRRGLLGLDSLPDGHALIIAPCNAIHTWFMRFTIDVVFVARDGRIVGLRHAVPPWRIAWAVSGFATIELPAGTLARVHAKLRDRLTLAPAERDAGEPCAGEAR
jgi:uncharacterized membrane protein (UPF0127 family)